MGRSWGRRRAGGRSRRQQLLGCLLWLVGVLVLLIILSVLFGSFQLGTKAKGMSPPHRPAVSAMPASGQGNVRGYRRAAAQPLVDVPRAISSARPALMRH